MGEPCSTPGCERREGTTPGLPVGRLPRQAWPVWWTVLLVFAVALFCGLLAWGMVA